MNEKCFGMKPSGKCRILNGRCPGYGACAFYKPRWMYERDLRLAIQRISRMPLDRQRYLADKYYRGTMPWKGAHR